MNYPITGTRVIHYFYKGMKLDIKTLSGVLSIIFIVGFLIHNDSKIRNDDHVETWKEFCEILNSPSRKGFFFTKSRTFELDEIRKEFTTYLNTAIKNDFEEEIDTAEGTLTDSTVIVNELGGLKTLGAWTEDTEMHIAYYSFLDGTFDYYVKNWEKLLDDKNLNKLSNLDECSVLTLDGFFTKLILHTNENEDTKTFDLKYFFKNDFLKR